MDHTENTLATNKATDATPEQTEENQAPAEKSYSQKEVDDMMARIKGSLTKKLLKPYEELGDPDTLRQLKAEAEKRQTEQQIKRGEFEKTLQELAAKKDAEIQRRDQVIKEYKVNAPLLNAAAKYRSINPEQVKQLLQNRVKLNDDGDVEVLDDKGSVQYTDAGTPYGVDDLVKNWLNENKHFQMPTANTTTTQSSYGVNLDNSFDISKLDMSKASDRAKFADYKKKQSQL
jgi:hypothetical protein